MISGARAWIRNALVLGAAGLSGCGGPSPRGATAKAAFAPGCHYEARLAGADDLTLEVEARCMKRGVRGFKVIESLALAYVHDVRDEKGQPLRKNGTSFELDGREPVVRYRVDLGAIANAADDFDIAAQVGRSIVAPVSTWLLEPNPVRPGAPLTLHLTSSPDLGVACGLRQKDKELFELEQQELHVATYSTFGRFTRHDLELAGRHGRHSTLEVVLLDGPLSAGKDALMRYIEDSVRAVSSFYQGFPVARAMVVVIPESARSGVLFGKVLPESSPAIALLVGQHTKVADLDRDWILVHELYHLGFPSFQGEGKWLDEGLATYYEPIIRTRAGLRTEASLWEEFLDAMPQGLGAVGRDGLENAQSFRGIYWGGAIVSLLADVEIRRRSGGKQGLENGLLALLDNDGHASEVWALQDAIGVVDRTVGAPVLGELAARYAARGHPLELDRLFSDLGVRRTPTGVKLDDTAPLAGVRRAIVYGARASF
jgi:hypothetical protein